VTLAVIGAQDTVKVIDQGDDGGVNATNLRRMIAATTGCGESADTRDATVVDPAQGARGRSFGGRSARLSVPVPEPLRKVEKSVAVCAGREATTRRCG
jgi:alpha-D-ribose 1-methylphosphonate 5-phosphate C-P lyase